MDLESFQASDCGRYVLEKQEGRLQLRKRNEPKQGAVYVDFITGAGEYRRKFGGGRKQAIAKAIGLKKIIKKVTYLPRQSSVNS